MDGVEALFVREAKLDREYLDDLRDAKDLRESADYGMAYSYEGARTLIQNAEKFFRKVQLILE